MSFSFRDIFQNMLGGQLIIRFCSFCSNLILLRVVEQSVLGFFNVRFVLIFFYANLLFFFMSRMNLFYNFGMLFREPFRKFCFGLEVPDEEEIHKYSVLRFILCIVPLSSKKFMKIYTGDRLIDKKICLKFFKLNHLLRREVLG